MLPFAQRLDSCANIFKTFAIFAREIRNLEIEHDSRLIYKFLKRLTGGVDLNTEVGKVQKKAADTI